MAAENLTEQERVLRDLGFSWFSRKYEGDTKYEALLKLKQLFREDVAGRLQIILHVPLTLIYTIFVSIMLAVFIRGKMLGLVQQVLILNAYINLVPMLVVSPFLIIFYYYADVNAPIPYPACFWLLLLLEYLARIAHMTGLHLKILLGVNRLCSVYKPFQTVYWFSKFRCKVYCTSVILSTVVFGCVTNFPTFPIRKVPCVGDIWGTGRSKLYYACSMMEATQGHDPEISATAITIIIECVMMLTMPVLLLMQNILFLVKLKRLAKKRNKMKEDSVNNCVNDKKMNMLNTISMWIMATSFVTEIPNAVVMGLILFRNVSILSGGAQTLEKYKTLEELFKWMVGIVFKVTVPIDLLIFCFCSKKTKVILKQRFVPNCRERKN